MDDVVIYWCHKDLPICDVSIAVELVVRDEGQSVARQAREILMILERDLSVFI